MFGHHIPPRDIESRRRVQPVRLPQGLCALAQQKREDPIVAVILGIETASWLVAFQDGNSERGTHGDSGIRSDVDCPKGQNQGD